MEPGSLWLLAGIAVLSFVLSFIGAAVGLILGHLRLPVLIAYLGGPGAGAMTNLIISGVGALGGSVRHLRDRHISGLGLALMGIPSAVGAAGAVLIFVQVSPLYSYLVIGAMLVISGINLIRKKPSTGPAAPISVARRVVTEVVLGLALGALAAITGLMLGSLRLPMMIRYLRMDPKQAVGTNMAVGCMTALVGATTAMLIGPSRLDWLVLAVVVPPTVVGGYYGGWLTGRITKEAVQKTAGWIVAVSGIILLAQGVNGIVRKKIASPPSVVVDESDFDTDGWWFELDDGAVPEEE
jgi:uncharacterized membrane protein YfcA